MVILIRMAKPTFAFSTALIPAGLDYHVATLSRGAVHVALALHETILENEKKITTNVRCVYSVLAV